MSVSHEQQLLSFTLEGDYYAIDINQVQEIRAVGRVRSLPNIPEHCVGVIDFRNSMVPIIDLRKLFNYENTTIDGQTVMIVVNISTGSHHFLVGIIVDSVSDVITIDPDKMKQSPQFGSKINVNFMQGMFRHDDHIVVLLTLEAVFAADEMNELQAFTQQVSEQRQ